MAKGDFNPKMYNSFTDGTKAAIEMAAVANGTGLDCPDDGLAFPPAGLHDLAKVFRPAADGGRLARSGLVDIAASQEPDGREVFNNIRYGVFVTFKAHNEYAKACFKQYGLLIDPSGWYGSMWRPFHMIGLETSISVLSAVLRGEPTGTCKEFRGDAVATAKRDLQPGEMLDGEGGFAVWANAIPASKSLAVGALPIGLAHNVKLKRPVAKDTIVRFDDVVLERDLDVVALRQEMEAQRARAAGDCAVSSGTAAGTGGSHVVIAEFERQPDGWPHSSRWPGRSPPNALRASRAAGSSRWCGSRRRRTTCSSSRSTTMPLPSTPIATSDHLVRFKAAFQRHGDERASAAPGTAPCRRPHDGRSSRSNRSRSDSSAPASWASTWPAGWRRPATPCRRGTARRTRPSAWRRSASRSAPALPTRPATPTS